MMRAQRARREGAMPATAGAVRAAVLLLAAAVPSATAVRQSLTFDYGWKYKLGDPESAHPPLQTASMDPTFTNISSGYACTQLAWSQLGRMGPSDCTGACSATPGCKAWMWAQEWPRDQANTRGCFIHDGTLGDEPVCTKITVDPEMGPASGGMRATLPPPIQEREGVTWKEPAFDDSAWRSVDVPHDFIIAGDETNTTSTDYPYSEAADGHHGYIPRDRAGWYRKHFTLPSEWAEGATWVHFEGIFQACDIFLNGQFLKRHTSGYLGFDLPLHSAPDVRFGATAGSTNVLALRVDASFGSGHWYEGGGIQRRVQLLHTPSATRFVSDGLFAQTADGDVTAARAVVAPSAEVISAEDASVTIQYTLEDSAGAVVAHAATQPASVRGGAAPTVVHGVKLPVANPQLWSVQEPHLYRLSATLHVGTSRAGELALGSVDSLNTTIGLRSIDWSGKHFKLNEQEVHIRGFSHHSDFGAVGGAVPDRINVFRANALRSVGGNWWRTSHNPYRPALYDILDKTGVLCWDENRDFNQMNVGDMEALVRRDRNHPSVVIWSACNEVECFVTGAANVTGQQMAAATKKWDTTRPFSANQNQFPPVSADPAMHTNDTMNYLSAFLDVEGFSHGSITHAGATAVYEANIHKNHISSECCSCQTQRGEDIPNRTIGLSYPHTIEQAKCMQTCMNLTYPKYSSAAGSAVGIISGTSGVWTLFDYGGEPGPWPLVSSSFGQFDYAGFAKSASYWYRALWLASAPENDYGRPPLPRAHVVRISQSWQAVPPGPPPTVVPEGCDVKAFLKLCPNGDGKARASCLACARAHQLNATVRSCDGVDVWPTICSGGASVKPTGLGIQVFSDLPIIELFLNGKSEGTAPCTPGGFAAFSLLHGYAPGNLTAVGMAAKGSEVLASHTIVTAGAPTAIKLSIDVPSKLTGTGSALVLDGHDTALIRATLVDSEGRIADASNLIHFEVESGPGQISGVHNGDAKSHEPQAASSRHAYHGLARAAIKVTRDTMSDALLTSAIEVAAGDAVHTVALGPYRGPMSIVVSASSPGLAPGKVAIPVSSDPADAPLAVAGADLRDELVFE